VTLARRIFLLLLASASALLAVSHIAIAQPYPSRPITIVAPYGAGGPADTLARVLADRMKTPLGQPVVIENVVGAAGTVGVGRVARATPDGYTVGIGNWGTHVLTSSFQKLPYDVLTDFEPVALLPNNPYIIISKNAVPATDLKQLIAWLKANPGKATAGTGGVGNGGHIAGAYFQTVTHTSIQFVPYRTGFAGALQDLLAGQIDLIFDQASNALPHVQAGKVRAYAVTAARRLTQAPNIPTVDEAGLPGFYTTSWYGLWVPKGTPKDVIARLNAAVVEALADPPVRNRLIDLGQEIPPREQQTPEALGAFHRAEMEKWTGIIKAANIKVE
jgi:tripartite-type tricarboxylate transporter receptor subunit TctC